MTSTSSYFTSTPSASSYTPSYSTLDRSRSEATIANSKSSADLSARIQATKDQHKLDIKKAMDFDRTTLKPPIITQKLPRPEPGKYSNLSSSVSSTIERSEREGRRREREPSWNECLEIAPAAENRTIYSPRRLHIGSSTTQHVFDIDENIAKF